MAEMDQLIVTLKWIPLIGGIILFIVLLAKGSQMKRGLSSRIFYWLIFMFLAIVILVMTYDLILMEMLANG